MMRELCYALEGCARRGLMQAIFSFACLTLSLTVEAQGTDPALLAQSQRQCRNCLGGHRFLPASNISDPFVTTHFISSTGGVAHRA